jgi:nucleotide-binding universal stress UspA family protein
MVPETARKEGIMSANTPTLRTILVATDGSADAALAAGVAAEIAGRSGAALHLVHAWMPVPAATYPYPSMPTTSAYRLYQSDAEAILAKAAGELTGHGVHIAATHLHCGPPVGSIASLGEDLKADLIVLGSRGLGPLRRLLLGSVSSGLAHEATRPLLVVRGGERAWPPRTIVMGDDGSPATTQVAGMAATLERLYEVPIALVHACAPLPRDPAAEGESILRSSLGMATPDPAATEAIREEHFHHASAMLNARAVALQGLGIARAEPEIVFGDPAAAIVDAAEAADPALVVVGSRGLGTIARLRLGSVSTKVLHAAAGPVLVVPQRGNVAANDSPAVYER